MSSSSRAKRKPLAILLSVALATIAFAAAPLVTSSAEASTTSSLKSKVMSDINSWRVHSEHGHKAKRNSRIDAYVLASLNFQFTSDPIKSGKALFLGVPTGYDAGTTFLTGIGGSAPTSVSTMAHAIAQQIESSDVNGYLAADNYVGIGVAKHNGSWVAKVSAYQYSSAFRSVSKVAHASVSGSVKAGSTLKAHINVQNGPHTAMSYEWFVDGSGVEDNHSFLVPGGDIGRHVTLLIIVNQAGKDASATEVKLGEVAAGTIHTAKVTVTGHRNVGSVLTVGVASWTPGGVGYSAQWYRGKSKIVGAIAPTYTQQAADFGHRITVRLTAQLAGYKTAHRQSTTSQKTGHPLIVDSVPPSISGTRTVGQLLTAHPGTWSPGTPTFTYQWKIAGKKVKGATNPTFTIPNSAYSASGKKITLVVTAHESGFQATSNSVVTSSNIEGLEFSEVGGSHITGTAAVGHTLTGVHGVWSPTPKFSYQWLRNGTPISHATKSTYKLKAADAGKSIQVVIRGTHAGYIKGTDTSSPVVVAS